MTTSESFVNHIWEKVGPACREQIREVWEIIERAPAEDRVKVLAAFFWANWCRGRRDHANGRETFWDMD